MLKRLIAVLFVAFCCLCPPILYADSAASNASALRSASYDGTWSGVVKCLYDPGIWPDDECDVSFTFTIQGQDLRITQVIRSKKGEETKSEINPQKFRFLKLSTNAVAVSMDSGNDEDGSWVETWSFVMTLADPTHMIAHWTRVVNNVDMPIEKKGSKFSSVGMGLLVKALPP